MTDKTIEKLKTKKKRLSKGMRKYKRRMKQDARKTAIYS